MEPSAGPGGSHGAALPAAVLRWSSRGWNRLWKALVSLVWLGAQAGA